MIPNKVPTKQITTKSFNDIFFKNSIEYSTIQVFLLQVFFWLLWGEIL